MEKIGPSHSLRFIVKDVLCRAADSTKRTVASISVKTQDKKSNSFISAFCFIQLFFHVDWMYTRFVVM